VLGIGGIVEGAMQQVAQAQTDITTAVTSMVTLWNSIEVVAIGVIIFIVGRRLFKKI